MQIITGSALVAIRKEMAAALERDDMAEYHRLGAEHRAILHAARPDIKAIWEAQCMSAHFRKIFGFPSSYPNPQFVEWMMGFPPGWTACEASATPSSRKSRKSLEERS